MARFELMIKPTGLLMENSYSSHRFYTYAPRSLAMCSSVPKLTIQEGCESVKHQPVRNIKRCIRKRKNITFLGSMQKRA